ncbi:rolling circle replication-associated protein, partial [Staphylococcus saprophyticus]|uniref:rolling circle replication-associated protein n=1 Tax=Staphylococcus saprophyticus TaxID=29385 RepID=UPI003BF841F7
MNVLEPQKRGAWHMHRLLRRDDGSYLRIKNVDLHKRWGKGFVKVKRLKQSDNVAAYLMAYLSDIELD